MLVISVLFPLGFLIGCNDSKEPCGSSEVCDTDGDADTDTDTDTDEPYVVSCDTGVVADEPCLVAADGSGTYATIQEAVDAASEGDVITVCPGVYDSVVIDTVGLTLQGHGADSTCIIGTSEPGLTLMGTFASPLEVDISGFTVSGNADDLIAGGVVASLVTGSMHDLRVAGVQGSFPSTAAYVGQADLLWERVTFEGNLNSYALTTTGTSSVIRDSVFRDNLQAFVWSPMEGTDSLSLMNCIFTDNYVAISINSGGTGLVANNVFAGNLDAVYAWGGMTYRNNVAVGNEYGFTGSIFEGDSDYNVAWGNFVDFNEGVQTGPNDMSVDPMFEDPAAHDFRLRYDSPLIDAGDPDPAYDDPDGSRNDIGAFGGPYGAWLPAE